MGSLIKRSTRKRGKATYMGKDLTGARSLQRKLMPDTVGSEQREPTSLRALASGGRWYIRFAEASATEEPGAEKLHAGVCAGGRP